MDDGGVASLSVLTVCDHSRLRVRIRAWSVRDATSLALYCARLCDYMDYYIFARLEAFPI